MDSKPRLPTVSLTIAEKVLRDIARREGEAIKKRRSRKLIERFGMGYMVFDPKKSSVLGGRGPQTDGCNDDLADVADRYRLCERNTPWQNIVIASVKAMRNLAVFYGTGNGTAKDIKEAVSWYKKCASAGDINSIFNVAAVSFYGGFGKDEGYPKDIKYAYKILRVFMEEQGRHINLCYYREQFLKNYEHAKEDEKSGHGLEMEFKTRDEKRRILELNPPNPELGDSFEPIWNAFFELERKIKENISADDLLAADEEIGKQNDEARREKEKKEREEAELRRQQQEAEQKEAEKYVQEARKAFQNSKELTKAEWKSTLAKAYSFYAKTGNISLPKNTWTGLVGEPQKTQTIGDKAYWYYECKDGTIQVEIEQSTLGAAGLVIGTVSDY